MASPRLQALQNLSNQLPVANQKVAQGQAAARDIQLQQSLNKLPPAPAPGVAAQVGAGQAQAAGQDQVKSATAQIDQQGQLGQIGLREQTSQNNVALGNQQAANRQLEMDNSVSLAQLDQNAKQELFDKQLQFRKDEAGRTLFNENQLADYAKVSARNDEEFKGYAQAAQQASQRRMQQLETAARLVEADLQQKYAQAQQANDQASMRKIAESQAAIKARIARETAKANNEAAMWTAGGTIVGGAAGAVLGGPAGAMAGASLGAGLGNFANTQVNQ